MKTKTNNSKRKFINLATSLLAIFFALLWIFPVYWMINSSLQSSTRLNELTPAFFPIDPEFSNYIKILQDPSFYNALVMSIAVTLLAVIACIVFAFFAALAISRFKFRGRKSFLVALLLIQMLPAEAMFIAQYKMISDLGLLNTVIGIGIIYTAAVIPFTIWMLRGFVAGIPLELEEAAMIDGLSKTKAFIKITFPLLAPGLIASGVFAFLQAWNEYTVALILLPKESARTLPLWLSSFATQTSTKATDWAAVMAASTLVAIPVIIFFVIVQGKMTSGMVSGAVKG